MKTIFKNERNHDQEIFILAFRIAEAIFRKPGQPVTTEAEILEEAKAIESLPKVFTTINEVERKYFPNATVRIGLTGVAE